MWVIVQELGRSEHWRGDCDPVVLAVDIALEDRLVICGEHLLNGLLVARHQIDAKPVGKGDQVAPGPVKTVEGQSLMVTEAGGAVMVDNAKVVKTDIVASNGVIHVIDSVILPH